MREHLSVLLAARSAVETNLLNNRLREIRTEANMNNVYGSSMQVNIAMQACSDYIDKFSKGALDDYKRAVSADPRRFHQDHLKNFECDFLAGMEKEVKSIRDLVERAVGRMIEYYGDPDGNWIQNYDGPSSLALKSVGAEVALFNMQLMESKPKFATRLKDWCEDKPLLVLCGYALGGATAIAILNAAFDIVADFID